MLSDDDVKRIRRAANFAVGSHFDRLKEVNNSTDLGQIIVMAIVEAIKEYESVREQ